MANENEGKNTIAAVSRSRKQKSRPSNKSSAKTKVTRVSAEQLPRRSLEQAMKVARVLHDVLSSGPAEWEQIASAMHVSPTSPPNKYPLWSAVAYNIITKDDDKFSLSEVGRKILAPTTPNEDKEAIVQAILTPTIFSRFFTDYNGNPFPVEEYIGNVLESRYGVPHDRLEEAKSLLRDNGLFAGILQTQQDGTIMVSLDPIMGVPKPSGITTGESTEKIPKSPNTPSLDYSNMCFIITPIGEDDSAQRKHSNMILKSIIEPVVSELDLIALRADQIDRSGIITQQIFECLAKARVAVADLSFNNPNAFYELGVRHMCKLPTVQIIRKGDKIPFDVSQGRTIKIDLSDVYSVMESVESARKELRQHLKHAISSEYKGEDNPVNTYLPGVDIKIPR